jgi:hypothetical protein
MLKKILEVKLKDAVLELDTEGLILSFKEIIERDNQLLVVFSDGDLISVNIEISKLEQFTISFNNPKEIEKPNTDKEDELKNFASRLQEEYEYLFFISRESGNAFQLSSISKSTDKMAIVFHNLSRSETDDILMVPISIIHGTPEDQLLDQIYELIENKFIVLETTNGHVEDFNFKDLPEDSEDCDCAFCAVRHDLETRGDE